MILVQNLRLQLNGNKTIKLFFFILSFIFSGINLYAVKHVDSAYKIAMILPFHFNDYNGANINRSNIMLDYYQGFYTALKYYETKGLKLKLFIYDNEHDTNITKEILQKPELKKMDLIISPILDEHLHILNHFSSKNQIAVFSPFTAADSLFPKNPLFFNAAPSEKSKAEAFFDYYRKNCNDKKILIFKSDSEKNENFENRLEELILNKNNVEYRFITEDDILNADSSFLPNYKEYFLYHKAENAKEVKTLISFLDKQNANIEILADYKPLVLKAIHYSKRNKYNIKIISSDYINPLDSAEKMHDFKNFYKTEFSLFPSRYSIIGHDQACLISEIFLKYKRFRAVDFTGENFKFYSTKFLFKKDPHCNQNRSLFILKYNDKLLEEVISSY
ncbi:MAG: hypothetical protein HUU47_04580 [Bacteroidetes bacterium]|nr:hypothetical protein [Bacteroidota bacterium]